MPVANGAYPISWPIASLPWREYHPTRRNPIRCHAWGLRAGVRHWLRLHVIADADLAWRNGERAIDGSRWRRVSGVGLAHEAAYRIVYDVVVITMTRVPVLAIMAAVVLSYLAYRSRPRPPKWGMWPGISRCLPRLWIPGRVGTRRMGRAARAAGDRLPPCRDMLGSISHFRDLRRAPEKRLGDAGGSVRGSSRRSRRVGPRFISGVDDRATRERATLAGLSAHR